MRNPSCWPAILQTTLIASEAIPRPQALAVADHEADLAESMIAIDRAELDVSDVPVQVEASDAQHQSVAIRAHLRDERRG